MNGPTYKVATEKFGDLVSINLITTSTYQANTFERVHTSTQKEWKGTPVDIRELACDVGSCGKLPRAVRKHIEEASDDLHVCEQIRQCKVSNVTHPVKCKDQHSQPSYERYVNPQSTNSEKIRNTLTSGLEWRFSLGCVRLEITYVWHNMKMEFLVIW